MRLTNVLYRVNYHRHFQRIWKRQGKLQAVELQIPEELKEMGIAVEDAKDILNETKLFPPVKKIVPRLPYPLPLSVIDKRKYFYVMDNTTMVSESENQALSLTKTVPHSGLPIQLQSLVGKDALPNQDELVQRSLLQAHIWDGDQYKLPKRVDPALPGHNFPRYYGTLNEKKVFGLLEKLTFLCDAAAGKYAACLQTDKFQDAFCKVSIDRNGDSVTFQMTCDILLTSHKPLQRIASPEEVVETTQVQVPDIYPIKPVLDLTKFDEEIHSSLIPAFDNKHIHTLFLCQKSYDTWLPNQMLARAIATCFAFCAKEAKMKHGINVKELPEPITIQCVYMDIQSFNFLVYQLNTLEMENNEGLKNQVWIDEPSPLYGTVSEKDLVTDYNAEIFRKMLAMYLNGL